MPKKLVIPPEENKICVTAGGWRIYRHPPTPADSPLWPCVKVVAPPGQRRRMGQLRAFWLYWGVDDGRFRRSGHARRLAEEQPAVFRQVVEALSAHFAPALVELQLGATAVTVERARLAVLRRRHRDEDQKRLEAAHAAALAEDAAREVERLM